jgi:hypothetical protein
MNNFIKTDVYGGDGLNGFLNELYNAGNFNVRIGNLRIDKQLLHDYRSIMNTGYFWRGLPRRYNNTITPYKFW